MASELLIAGALTLTTYALWLGWSEYRDRTTYIRRRERDR